MSISYGGDYITDTDGGKLRPSSAVMRNRIINGAMVINQRGFSGTATDGVYTLDRWRAYTSQASKYTVSQNAGSITPPAGFVNYLGVTSSTATTVGSTDYYMIRQPIEGYNIADLGWGTSNAKTVTLSFWVYSSLTGTFGGSLENSAGTYSYPFSYSISSANTWTQISITVTGQTAGAWSTTNSTGLILQFSLGMGSTLRGTANTWANAEYWSVTGETQIVATSGATWYLTGVQLEVGSSATGFEYRQYGQELQLCQRYFETAFDIGTVPANNTIGYYQGIMQGTNSNTQGFPFKVMKRNQPTMTYYSSVQVASPTAGQWQYTNSSGTWVNGVATQTNRSSMSMFSAYVNSTGISAGQAACVSGGWTADSEL